jgi:hypothetical protein
MTQESRRSIADDWMAWLVLRHFLPARQIRDLANKLVDHASGSKVTVDQLFENSFAGDRPWSESWIVRPLPAGDSFTGYLQRLVRAVVWQNDQGGVPDLTFEPGKGTLSPELLEGIFALGHADFDTLEFYIEPLERYSSEWQPSLSTLVQLLRAALSARKSSSHKPGTFWSSLAVELAACAMPLAAVATKHLADLCADADSWQDAMVGYKMTGEQLMGWNDPENWSYADAAWKTVAQQSYAAAQRIIVGPRPASEVLADALGASPLETNPLLALNASLDAMNFAAHPLVLGFRAIDRRAGILQTPLLASSHDSAAPLRSWLARDYRSANRHFWEILRRYLAAGCTTEARAIKVDYARCIFDELHASLDRETRPESFRVALRLVLEAGNSAAVERLEWNEPLVDRYVTDEAIQFVLDRARAFDGVRIERERVVIELFKAWVNHADPSKTALSSVMLKHVARLACEFDVSIETALDVARPALQALQTFAHLHSELRSSIADDVLTAIRRQLGEGKTFWAPTEAIKLAIAYTDVFSDAALRTVVSDVLVLLRQLDPMREEWTVVRPALNLLTSSRVASIVRSDEELSKDTLNQIFRFGLEQKSERTRIFFYLHNFDSRLLGDEAVRSRLSEPLRQVRAEAKRIGSSDVTDHIYALLLNPSVSGYDGVRDALDGLEAILMSVTARRISMGLISAYDPILLLVRQFERMRTELKDHENWLKAALERLFRLVVGVWDVATKNPSVFAPFSIPPTTEPHPVVVHNWAFASLELAEVAGHREEIQRVLDNACSSQTLAGPVAGARATRALARKIDLDDSATAKANDRASFYMSLGRHLVQLQRTTGETKVNLCKLLARQCLRFGPRDLDVAVLLEAARMNLHDHIRASGLGDYVRRVERDRSLRNGLLPVARLFSAEHE